MSAVTDDVAHGSVPGEPPVEAPFSPNSSAAASSVPRGVKQTIIVLPQAKSPLLLATPPQVTRALAFSYPFFNPISRLVGLVSWSTGDPWESFLLLACFWFVVLYGDIILRWAGPLLFVAFLTAGMYARRFSVLSSNRRPAPKSSSEKPKKSASSGKGAKGKTRDSSHGQPKSLDEIVAALQQFTSRCNILLDPFLQMTDFLSTQVTATSATTRPALVALFTRLLVLSPIWYFLTLWPMYIVTTRRVVLSVGTLVLSWHSRPARVSRTLLWRSRTVRKLCEVITGLSFTPSSFVSSSAPRGVHSVGEIEKSIAAAKREKKAKTGSATISTEGIRFTFSLFENQRRWIGIGWTSSMLAYERAAWTDDQLNPAPPKDQFKLPTIEGGAAKWRWAEGSEWEVDIEDDAEDDATADGSENRKQPGSPHAGTSEEASWVYYDNHWTNGRRGIDGWGRYTRRRKWVRDAELVEVSPGENEEVTPTASPSLRPSSASEMLSGDSLKLSPESVSASASATAPRAIPKISTTRKTSHLEVAGSAGSSGGSLGSASGNDQQQHRKAPAQRRSWFGRRKRSDSTATASSIASGTTLASDTGTDDRDDHDDDGYIPLQYRGRQGADWGLGDDVGMELG